MTRELFAKIRLGVCEQVTARLRADVPLGLGTPAQKRANLLDRITKATPDIIARFKRWQTETLVASLEEGRKAADCRHCVGTGEAHTCIVPPAKDGPITLVPAPALCDPGNCGFYGATDDCVHPTDAELVELLRLRLELDIFVGVVLALTGEVP
jgi:hypothetical protein